MEFDNMELPVQSIERLLVKDACIELVLKGARCIDNAQYSLLEEVFDAQASLQRPGGAVLIGLPAIVASYCERSLERITRHVVLNTRFESVTDTRARGLTTVLLWSGNAADEAGPAGRRASARQTLGTFDDVFIRTAAGWRVGHRAARFELFYEPSAAMQAEQPR